MLSGVAHEKSFITSGSGFNCSMQILPSAFVICPWRPFCFLLQRNPSVRMVSWRPSGFLPRRVEPYEKRGKKLEMSESRYLCYSIILKRPAKVEGHPYLNTVVLARFKSNSLRAPKNLGNA